MIIQRDHKSALPRMRFLPPLHAFKVFFSSLSGRDAPIKTTIDEQQVAGIERHLLGLDSSSTHVMSYLQTGPADGRRVVFVHGTPGKATGWADYLLSRPDGYRYSAVDRLGYGLSKPEHAVVSLTCQAQAIAPLLADVHGRKAIVVGHSSGASVALQTALDFPGQVGGVLLLAGAFDPELEEANWIQLLGRLKPVSRLLSRAIDNANQELLGLKAELMAQADRLQQIIIPVGIVHGDRDPLVPVANVDYLERKLTNASLDTQILKNCDHFIPWHSKVQVEAALERLVHRVRRSEV